ncbi:potassium channel family protein [Metabacillus sediminilitoris]|uniref:Potassium channel protein n=1 Tax=Metabacillus sediminilitoris TaxID=2567941 RepID=A0A4S4C240_9BACI|nr:potassium channel protein [Metabacillus sediminilitoris]QGQ47812.1 potassium channel protein [Metabacillus sediminilitoris]THF81075.1 potassium channel protein [Metabacillus sediminilitoris]
MANSNKTIIHWLRWPLYYRLTLIVLLIILVFGSIMSLVEPNEFPTTFDGIWWAVVTISTVGFGDYVPHTYVGRGIAMLMIIVGASFVTAYFATISAAAIKSQHSYMEGERPFKGTNHVVLIGWNEKANEMIESLLSVKPYKQIVLIDETLHTAPLIENVHFIRGNPSNDRTLQKANIEDADAAIITADQHKNEHDADMYSILVLLTLKGVNPKLYCVIEILTEHQANNASRAGADEIIKSYKLTSHFMMSSYLAKNGLSHFYSELNPASGNLFQVLPVTDRLVGKTFRDASHELLDNESILIGVKRGEETKLNPPLTYQIQANDSLIVYTH